MRRGLLPLLLAFAALPAGVADAASRVADFTQTARVAAPPRAHAAGAWRLTAPLRAPARFELLGVVGDDAPAVRLRVRHHGRWTRWAEADGGEPVWTGAAQTYQLRVAGTARAVRLHFVAVPHPDHAPLAKATAGGRPAIVPRSAWDPHGDCPPRVTPIYGRVDFALVHHTVSLNGYSAAATPGIVLAICRFHRNGNGWNDIGYDFLVDRYGAIYEGRAGGVEDPVVGAQAQGWNGVSTGVAAIGDFSSAPPPGPLLHSIARVLAWKLGLAGVPARGTIRERSIGGDLNRWPQGARVTFQRIAGHRDGDATDCPGGALYAQLPLLRTLVQRLLPAPHDLLTISPARAPQPQGGPVLLTGRLARADGQRPAGQAVVLQQLAGGVWSDVASVTTGADGIWSAALALTQNGDVRAVTVASGIVSAVVPIQVQAGVSLHASSRHPRLGAPIVLSGTTTPAKTRVRILVERRNPSGRFRRVQNAPFATSEGHWTLALRLPSVGVYRVRVGTLADAVNAAGSSRTVTVRVLHRG